MAQWDGCLFGKGGERERSRFKDGREAMRRVRKMVLAAEWESGDKRRNLRGVEGAGAGGETQKGEEQLGRHGHVFGELRVGSLTLSLAFLSRKDHWDKMRSKVTLSPPTHITIHPLACSLTLRVVQCKSPHMKSSHGSFHSAVILWDAFSCQCRYLPRYVEGIRIPRCLRDPGVTHEF